MSVFAFTGCINSNGFEELLKDKSDKVNIKNNDNDTESVVSYDWTTYKNITINADTLSLTSNVNNYPLLIHLNRTNFPDIENFTDTGGADIRFTSIDDTELPYEIENWVDSTSGYIWVLIDSVSNITPTTIKMYYNNPGAENMSNSETVFDTTNGFQGVWHLNETQTDEELTGSHFDSTSNNNIATQKGNVDIPGISSRGQSFDGNDYIDCGKDSSLSITGNITLSLWINMDSDPPAGITSSWYPLIAKANSRTYNMYLYKLNSLSPVILHYDTIIDGIEHWVYLYSAQDEVVNPEIWKYITVTFNGSAINLYVDSVLDFTYNVSGSISSSEGESVFIGKDLYGGNETPFRGKMDEVRISNTARSGDWIKLDYATQKKNQNIVDISL